jgi:NADH:ubiquinone oxidoreductase subunit F (NADH-binding)
MRPASVAETVQPPRLVAPRRLLPRGAKALVSLDAHLAEHGPLPTSALLRSSFVGELARSGLTGRGGAGFPTARKFESVARAGRERVVLVNATESEPLAEKDRLLCRVAPHLVLDGAEVAAETIGASSIVVVAHAHCLEALRGASAARAGRVPFTGSCTVERAAPGFVGGEESALVNWLNNGKALPMSKPPRPFERGISGLPTLVLNAETTANLALIARHGAKWFRAAGTVEEPGTLLLTVRGAVARPGVYEVPLGTSIADLLELAGEAPPGTPLLVGGYFGAFLCRGARAAAFSREGLAPHGASTGAGVVQVLGEEECGLMIASAILRYLAGQSAGQCGPCRFGLDSLAGEFERLTAGDTRASRAQLSSWADQITGRGACSHPDGTVNLLRSALKVFSEEIDRHAAGHCVAASPGSCR